MVPKSPSQSDISFLDRVLYQTWCYCCRILRKNSTYSIWQIFFLVLACLTTIVWDAFWISYGNHLVFLTKVKIHLETLCFIYMHGYIYLKNITKVLELHGRKFNFNNWCRSLEGFCSLCSVFSPSHRLMSARFIALKYGIPWHYILSIDMGLIMVLCRTYTIYISGQCITFEMANPLLNLICLLLACTCLRIWLMHWQCYLP